MSLFGSSMPILNLYVSRLPLITIIHAQSDPAGVVRLMIVMVMLVMMVKLMNLM